MPASAATPSFSVRPMATPMAKSSGQIAEDGVARLCHDQGDMGEPPKLALPTPRRIPATGRTETGSIMHLPIFCRREKAFLNEIMYTVR